MRRLMSGSPFVALSQRIDRSKNTVIDNIKLVGLRDCCSQSDDQSECYSFHNTMGLLHIFALGKIRGRQR